MARTKQTARKPARKSGGKSGGSVGCAQGNDARAQQVARASAMQAQAIRKRKEPPNVASSEPFVPVPFLRDLPVEAAAGIATFLPWTNRVYFAAALKTDCAYFAAALSTDWASWIAANRPSGKHAHIMEAIITLWGDVEYRAWRERDFNPFLGDVVARICPGTSLTYPSELVPIPPLNEFPLDGILANVAEFLPGTSRLSFAAAMTASAAKWEHRNWDLQLSAASRAIVGCFSESEGWRDLWFGDLSKSQQKALTDGELGGILACLNATPNFQLTEFSLKEMDLYCARITGAGLEPLRDSLALEYIDLRLFKSEGKKKDKKKVEVESAMSESIVLPILDSIIGAEGSSLRSVEFPRKWNATILENRSLICQKCSGPGYLRLAGRGDEPEQPAMTCSECTSIFCSDCTWENSERCGNNEKYLIDACESCENAFCLECTSVYICDECGCRYCGDCNFTRMRGHLYRLPEVGDFYGSGGIFACDNCLGGRRLRDKIREQRSEIKRLKRLVGEEVEDSDGSEDSE